MSSKMYPMGTTKYVSEVCEKMGHPLSIWHKDILKDLEVPPTMQLDKARDLGLELWGSSEEDLIGRQCRVAIYGRSWFIVGVTGEDWFLTNRLGRIIMTRANLITVEFDSDKLELTFPEQEV